MDLSTLAGQLANVDVPYGEHTIKVSYRPSEATPARLKAATTPTDDEDEVDTFIQFIVDIVAKWDLTNGPKKKVPLTPEGVATVPFPILSTIMAEVVQDAQGGGSDVGEAASSSGAG